MRSILLIALFFSAVLGVYSQLRIIGGAITTIQNYPCSAAALITVDMVNYNHYCGGVILNSRSVLSAAACFYYTVPQTWRIRVGSSYANSGGSVYAVSSLISHPDFEYYYKQNDVGIYRISSTFVIGGNIQLGKFAGPSYTVADNQTVTAIGWGVTAVNGQLSEQLRSVQIRTVNWNTCRTNYNIIAMTVTANMSCAGNLEKGGEAACNGDYGGPLLHNGNVIGIASWDGGCAYRGYPTVYTSVPKYITWIQTNA